MKNYEDMNSDEFDIYTRNEYGVEINKDNYEKILDKGERDKYISLHPNLVGKWVF